MASKNTLQRKQQNKIETNDPIRQRRDADRKAAKKIQDTQSRFQAKYPTPTKTKTRPYPMQRWQQVADLQAKNAQLEKKLAQVNRERDGLQTIVHGIMALNVFAGMAMQRAA